MNQPVIAVAAAAVPGWLLAAHLLGVLGYAGGILTVSRMLGTVGSLPQESRAGAASAARRAYLLFLLPMGVLMVGSGLWLLIGDPGGQGYMKQAAFHVKLTLVAVLMIVEHLMVIRPLKALSKGGGAPPDPAAAATAHALCLLLVAGILGALFLMR
ncbi:MAG: hypothetical protein L6R43_09235 [Planctomycetes bacterium]|nr:hypothetical protein [Planctomycetota bacterium]